MFLFVETEVLDLFSDILSKEERLCIVFKILNGAVKTQGNSTELLPQEQELMLFQERISNLCFEHVRQDLCNSFSPN